MPHTPPRAVLDTCVLYKPTIRGILLEAAFLDLFRPVWSKRILAELAGLLAARVPLSPDEASQRVRLTVQAFPDAMVDFKPSLERRMRNDPKDRHVLAAAVAGHAEHIVTENLKDFPDEATAPYNVRTIPPDTFLMMLLQQDGNGMMEAFQSYAASRFRVNPHENPWTIIARLRRNNVSVFARSIETNLSDEWRAEL